MNNYPTLKDLLVVVGVFACASLVGGLIVMPFKLLGMTQGMYTAFSYALGVGGTIWVVRHLRGERTGGRRWPISLRFRLSWLPAMGWAIVMIAALGVVLEPLLALFPMEWYEDILKAMGSGGWVIITSVVLAPLLEEWLFRGILQPPAVAKWGALRGILVSSAIFGVIHFIPMQVVNAFFVGLVLGYLFHKTGSLIPVILLHALNNGVAAFQKEGEATMMRDMISNNHLYFTLYGVALALVVLGAVFMVRELSLHAQRPTLDGNRVP